MSALLGEAKGHPQRLRGWQDHRDDLHATWQRYEPACPPRALTEGHGRSCTGSHGRRATSPNCFPRFPVLQGEMDRPCRARPADPVPGRGGPERRCVRDRTDRRTLGPCWVRAAPGPQGLGRSPAVTKGQHESQVDGYPAQAAGMRRAGRSDCGPEGHAGQHQSPHPPPRHTPAVASWGWIVDSQRSAKAISGLGAAGNPRAVLGEGRRAEPNDRAV
jgi:hypothetical protein